MRISPISINNSASFKSGASNITKDLINKTTKNNTIGVEKAIPVLSAVGITIGGLNEFLKDNGITYCEPENNYINIISGQNTGFFKLNAQTFNLTPLTAKNFVVKIIENESGAFGGFLNFKNMVDDLKRQDIIRKGLQIYTYELNSLVPKKDQELAAKKLSTVVKREIKPKNLFFIEEQAFYYDKYGRTAYRINLYDKNPTNKAEIAISRCAFDVDKNGCAVGYAAKNWNFYHRRKAEETYKEQLEPSEKLPEIANSKNNKLFAESFRFGNTEQNYKFHNGIPKVLEHLSKRVGVKDPSNSDLQYIKFYDKDNNINYRIGYFDSSTGRSLIYSEFGKYMYQLEYNKNDFGEIIACARF